MKTSSIMVAGLMILLTTSFAVSAQAVNAQTEPPVKILPTTQKGILKVLYAAETKNGVEVKFFDDNGVLALDQIREKSAPNGFTKRYNIKKVESENLWVQIRSDKMNVTYKLISSSDGYRYEPLLETITYNPLTVAAKN